MTRIRWRLNDPAQENRQRWTKVHVLDDNPPKAADMTLCGMTVPDWNYMEDRGEQVPVDAPLCKRCRDRINNKQHECLVALGEA